MVNALAKKNILSDQTTMMSILDETILERHSTRRFLPLPVRRVLADEALALAQHAPSNASIQPWGVVFINGAARDRLRDALFKGASHEAPRIRPLPQAFAAAETKVANMQAGLDKMRRAGCDGRAAA